MRPHCINPNEVMDPNELRSEVENDELITRVKLVAAT